MIDKMFTRISTFEVQMTIFFVFGLLISLYIATNDPIQSESTIGGSSSWLQFFTLINDNSAGSSSASIGGIDLLPVSFESLSFAAPTFLAFYTLLFAMTKYLPGTHHLGFRTPFGERLPYKINGIFSFLIVCAALVALALNRVDFGVRILSHVKAYFVVANVFAVLFTAYLHWHGREECKKEYSSEPLWSRVWFGVSLNPRVLNVDVKMYFYEPSLISLFVFNFCFLAAQREMHGIVTPQMLLYVFFWWSYLLTHYARESFMLSTWDIIAERFGFMLVWGDVVYLPFLYSLSGWSLVGKVQKCATSEASLIVICVGYWFAHYLFRTANWQKDDFRRHGEKAWIWFGKPRTLKNLLISGWWGIGRKLNYTGEILTYVGIAALSFTTATSNCERFCAAILPFSLFCLLTQRAWRDEQRCSEKYGILWEEYSRIARFKMIPFLY